MPSKGPGMNLDEMTEDDWDKLASDRYLRIKELERLVREAIHLLTVITNDGSDHEWICRAELALKDTSR